MIKGTNWADKAQNAALKEFDGFGAKKIKEHLSWIK
jgi:hypothetical protein